MKKSIFRAIFLTSLAVILITICGSLFFASRLTFHATEASLQNLLFDLSQTFETQKSTTIAGKFGDTRITLVNESGKVLFDSSGKTRFDNHSTRPEILLAKEKDIACLERASATLSERMLYCAKRLSDNRILRVSRSYENVYAWVKQLALFFIPLIFLMLIVAQHMAKRLSEKILAPVKSIDLNEPLKESQFVYDELTPLLSRIYKQSKENLKKTEEIALQRSEFLSVTDSMSEGFLLLSPDVVVLKANQSARRLLASDEKLDGTSFEKIDREIYLALRDKKNISPCVRDIEKNGLTLRIHASSIAHKQQFIGFVILLTDITQERLAEKMRQEFTANVSHELKTPLQSIAGSAELLENNLVLSEDVPSFAHRIVRETRNMATLVNDILFLSKLDEGRTFGKPTQIRFSELVNDIFEALKLKAEEKKLKLSFEGEDFTITAIYPHFFEILQNLVDNAIKYNKVGGFVCVRATLRKETLKLSVTDSGIGIAAADQSRVFERFWRADTSHSKTIPGTGLGLSIVKRLALLYNGSITVKSQPDVGSTFTVELPNIF